MFGKGALTYQGPALLNYLPYDLKMSQSTTAFKSVLKNDVIDNIHI